MFIARSKVIAFAQRFESPTVAVIPDRNNWNDFGRDYFAELYIFEGTSELFAANIRIMLEGHNRSEIALKQLIEEFGEIFRIEKVATPFVSLLPEEDMYRQVIALPGFDQGGSALRKLLDAVVLRFEGVEHELIHLTYGEEFSISVLHYGGAYSALRLWQ